MHGSEGGDRASRFRPLSSHFDKQAGRCHINIVGIALKKGMVHIWDAYMDEGVFA